MQAVVLVGGKGTRLRPLTLTTPKPLVPLANRPLIEHIVRWLDQAGVEEVVLLTQFKARAFEDWIRSWQGVPVRAIQEPIPLGTAGAVANVAQFLHGTTAVVNGDNITDLDLRTMELVHRSERACVTIAVDDVDDPTGRGVVVAGQDGRVSGFQEKPVPGTALANSVNTGTYLVEPEALGGVEAGQAAMWETDIFLALIASGAHVHAFRAPHLWLDAGTPRGYFAAQRAILAGAVSSPPGIARNGVWTQPGTVCGANVIMTGPVAMAANSRIGAGSVLEGPSSIGTGCRIESGVKITQSAIWDGCLVEQGATVANSIIGYNCTIGRQAHVDGALLGDGVIVGAGARLQPGTALEPRSVVERA